MHPNFLKSATLIFLLYTLVACSTIKLDPGASHVEVAAEPLRLDKCQYLGETVGSEGHWYTYLFLSNRKLVHAAVYDLRNKAAKMGGDTVFIRENTPFASSVTLLGLVYKCKKTNK